MRLIFNWQVEPSGLRITASRSGFLGLIKKCEPASEWSKGLSGGALNALGRLLRLESEGRVELSSDGQSMLVPHDVVAALPNALARELNLPPAISYPLDIRSEGTIDQDNYAIHHRFLKTFGMPLIGEVQVEGAIARHGNAIYRVPEPIFSVLQALRRLENAPTPAAKAQAVSEVHRLVGDDAEAQGMQPDAYVKRVRIQHASAFTLALASTREGFDFDPILFDASARGLDGNQEEDPRPLLLEAHQDTFAKKRFRILDDVRDRYALGDGLYVSLDPVLKLALGVVRKAQDADPETRRRFARSPQAYLKEALGESYDESCIEGLFVPTREYSERVISMGIWEPKVLPWVQREPGSWIPKEFGLKFGGECVQLSRSELVAAAALMQGALSEGAANIEVNEKTIPVSKSVLEAITGLARELGIPLLEGKKPETEGSCLEPESEPPIDSKSENVFLEVGENFEATTYHKDVTNISVPDLDPIPVELRSTLKLHQAEGLGWLQAAWESKLPGVLLADDMGLGKTLTTLAFLCWVRQARKTLRHPSKPMLVVAPTGLLENWAQENDIHFHAPGLGEPLKAYGTGIKRLRIGKSKDIHHGLCNLDTTTILEAPWVLTSYETLRDYHHSFATVPFACAVFDEAQKVKNPGSQLSAAAKTVNSDFFVALTGTPVENRIEDLWGIMDAVVAPGFLPVLKEFSEKYGHASEETLKELKEFMTTPALDGSRPAVMLRRLKSDRLKDLPTKRIHKIASKMPDVQAQAYLQAIRDAHGGNHPLKVLHQLRSVSLAPLSPDNASSDESFIKSSARLRTTMDILREIAARREKVLIFLESLDMQEFLVGYLQKAFNLPRPPLVISGDVPGPKRQPLVRKFQGGQKGFDVMLISTKAGGVGLNLTAANNVIHLTRWWNPAVEDQCTDRAYRIGQINDVNVYYPMAEHPSADIRESSFDLRLDELHERKRAMSKDLLLPPEINVEEQQELIKAMIGSA